MTNNDKEPVLLMIFSLAAKQNERLVSGDRTRLSAQVLILTITVKHLKISRWILTGRCQNLSQFAKKVSSIRGFDDMQREQFFQLQGRNTSKFSKQLLELCRVPLFAALACGRYAEEVDFESERDLWKLYLTTLRRVAQGKGLVVSDTDFESAKRCVLANNVYEKVRV